MANLTKSILIAAPVEKVFTFVDDPTHMPEYWPSMVEVRNVKELGGGYRTFDWTYKMAGLKLDGSSEVTEYVLNELLATAGKGGVESKFHWIFTPENGGTRLKVIAEYTVPIPVLGKLAESIILKQNEREADIILANLKAILEANVAA